jgi:protoheme IX farnesyltransferase
VALRTIEGKWTQVLMQRLKDFQLLVKLRLSLTVVFSSVMAFLIASSGSIEWQSVLILAMGGFLVTGAANILNEVLEKDFDKLMKRTADRPLAAGRMQVADAVMAAGFMSMSGITLLALFNPWTAFLGMLSLVTYSFVYTPMKRISPAAVVVGAIPGALPTLIGCVAAQGELTLLGWSLFAIQFLWQFPHFWSIGWLGFEDYKKAGYKLFPEKDGKQDTSPALQALVYALLLIPTGLLPYYLGASGIISAVLVGIMSVAYAWFALGFYRQNDRKSALQLMFFSFIFIPVSLIVLYIDKL